MLAHELSKFSKLAALGVDLEIGNFRFDKSEPFENWDRAFQYQQLGSLCIKDKRAKAAKVDLLNIDHAGERGRRYMDFMSELNGWPDFPVLGKIEYRRRLAFVIGDMKCVLCAVLGSQQITAGTLIGIT